MAIVISGVNNNDKITAADGTIDLLSGVSYASTITAPGFTANGNITAASINIGSGIQLGNAGIVTATTFVGNLNGNINGSAGTLLLQTSGSERIRIGPQGQIGIAGTNYGTSGQVLTSGGSGSAATWSTLTGVTINNNANNRIITGNTGTTLDAESTLTYDGNTLKFGGGSAPSSTTYYNDIVIDNSDTASGAAGGGGIKIYSGNQSWGGLIFGDSDADQVGFVKYSHSDNVMHLAANGTTYMQITNAGIVSCSNSTTGFLPPKGTTAQRTGIGVTPTGMIRYNTTTNNLELYKPGDSGDDWVNITARSSNFNMNYLVIGGGGAGAYRTNWNSESQGGGQSSGASKPVSIAVAYSIVVGAGGAANTAAAGSAGGQSKFDDIVSDGGTGGGRYQGAAPTNSGNGSGGGGGGHTGVTQPGGAAGTYGYAGGGGSSGPQCGGGGGGAAGAGIVGGSGGTNGDGGSALASTITGSSVLRAGGGGGGAGDGAYNYQNGKNATANTGSGGGGSPGDNTLIGGNGGSGIVILRFSSDYTANFTSGVTKTEATVGNETVVTITATSDSSQTVTFA